MAVALLYTSPNGPARRPDHAIRRSSAGPAPRPDLPRQVGKGEGPDAVCKPDRPSCPGAELCFAPILMLADGFGVFPPFCGSFSEPCAPDPGRRRHRNWIGVELAELRPAGAVGGDVDEYQQRISAAPTGRIIRQFGEGDDDRQLLRGVSCRSNHGASASSTVGHALLSGRSAPGDASCIRCGSTRAAVSRETVGCQDRPARL
jgi:hypothetical protein